MKTYTPTYQLAVQMVLNFEGLYSDHKEDRGGQTKYGISSRSYPDLDIKRLTRDHAIAIYHRDYWSLIRGDDLPDVLAVALFDAAVHHGVRRAVRLFQIVVGVKADGYIGSVTVKAAVRKNTSKTLNRYLAKRAVLFHDIVTANSSQDKFIEGWMYRLIALRAKLERL